MYTQQQSAPLAAPSPGQNYASYEETGQTSV